MSPTKAVAATIAANFLVWTMIIVAGVHYFT